MFHLVYNSDNNYLLPTFVSAASALFHASDPSEIVIDVLDCGIDASSWSNLHARIMARFPSCGGVWRHSVDCEKIVKYRSWRGSVATYARILTPDILTNLDMCLFVDGDTLFVSDPIQLQRLYDDRYWIQGSIDYHFEDDRKRLYAEYGLTLHNDYVCCGLMLMNLAALRRDGFSAKCFAFLDRYTVLTSVDQEAINSIAHGHISPLPEEWGVFSCMAYSRVKLPKCWHYVFGKPWTLNIGWTRCLYDMDKAWFSYAHETLGIRWKELGFHLVFKYYWRLVVTLLVSLCRIADRPWRNGYFTHGRVLRTLHSLCPFYAGSAHD